MGSPKADNPTVGLARGLDDNVAEGVREAHVTPGDAAAGSTFSREASAVAPLSATVATERDALLFLELQRTFLWMRR
jgi:hypothetical protein